ncbi:hypothetical protein AXE65_02335 [Ventosimonas gracilis]|uniref:Uncharacterized protein n=1 Tax=Ventosimonas gracilis TaxID=1680762 RepID=A0A139SUX1_9GAMM|nr:hypothetical protein [Ventosimonas gracilis]KXU38250.1 hypothetical protein AXE65_02335 [Ventosimonas gracilis]
MNTQAELIFEQNAQQIMLEEPAVYRRKAVQQLINNNREVCVEMLMAVANLVDYTKDEIHHSEPMERLVQYTDWLNYCAKQEAIIYAKEERRLAEMHRKFLLKDDSHANPTT